MRGCLIVVTAVGTGVAVVSWRRAWDTFLGGLTMSITTTRYI